MYIHETEDRITTQAVEESSAKYIPSPAVLFVVRSGILRRILPVALTTDVVTVNQDIKTLSLNDDVVPEYLYYFLLAENNRILKACAKAGTTVESIEPNLLKKVAVPLPPLPIQRQIVARIEELFSEVDAGVKELQTALRQLKTYRQAVLQNLFFEAGRNNSTKTIGDVAHVGTGVTPLKSNKLFYEGGNIPWITSGSLNELFVKEADGFVTEYALSKTNLKLYPKHTLLVALYGEGKTRGKCSELLIEATTNQAIAAIVLKPEYEAVRPFLKWYLIKNYEDIRKLSAGGVQPNLNLGIIKATEFPFPNLEMQSAIVAEIEAKLSEAEAMEATIRDGLAKAEALRQSILKRAFEGRLVSGSLADVPEAEALSAPAVPAGATGQMSLF